MTENQWEIVDEVAGMGIAEIVRGLLESFGISVNIIGEGAAQTMGMVNLPIGRVQILVPEEDTERAREILSKFHTDQLAEEDGE